MEKLDEIIGLLDRVKGRFCKSLGIADFEVRIRDDFRTSSPEANSLAILIPEQYILYLDKISELIFSSKEIFKGLGDASKETLEIQEFKISSKILTFDAFLKTNDLKDCQIQLTPNSKDRLEFSRVIASIMLTFSIFHELGHVRQLNYQPNNQKVITEDGDFESDLEECQIAEIDADIFAADFIGFYIYWALLSDSVPLGLTKKQFVHSVVYSIILLFYLLNNDDEIQSRKRHPHPLVRLNIITNFVEHLWIKNDYVASIEEFGSIIRCAISDVNDTINSLFGKGEDYWSKFKNDEVRIELDKFKGLVEKYPHLNFNRPCKLDY